MVVPEKAPLISVRVNFTKCEADQYSLRFETELDELVIKHLPKFCKTAIELNKLIAAMKGEAI